MPTYNYKSRELIAKIVYYGPGRCGKTTNLQQIHARMRPETRSELLSVATETDRTIYFDLLPLNLGTISGMKFMVRLFTVPGQVYYSETRKLVLRGADGIVFVADSQDHMLDENRQSLRDLKDNLAANGLDYGSMPLVFQYNKRDLPRLVSEPELDAVLNDRGVKASGAVASEGAGVLETLRFITLSVFNNIKQGGRDRGASSAALGGPQMFSSPTGSSPQPSTLSAPMGQSGQLVQPASFAPPAPLTGQGGALQRAMATAAAASGRMPPPPPAASVPTSGRGGFGPMTPANASQLAPRGQGGLRDLPPPNTGSTRDLVPTPAATRVQGRGPSTMGAPGGFGGQGPMGRAPSTPSMMTMNPGQPPRPVSSSPPPAPLNPNGPQPVKIGPEIVLEEFKNLAVMHSQLAERLAAIENEVGRLGRENQEIREVLAHQHHDG
jgi:signal recognition particle receptor subunit beta